MIAFVYINVYCFAVALFLAAFWARLIVWISQDLANLPDQPALVWKSLLLASLGLMLIFWFIPNFWVALLLNLLLVVAPAGWYLRIRVRQLGSAGDIFGAISGRMENLAQGRQARRSTGQLALSYRVAGRPPPLPPPGDPAWNSMVQMDRLIVQAMENRAQRIDLIPGPQTYDLRFTIDGVAYPQDGLPRASAETVIQTVKSLVGFSLEERRRPQKGAFAVTDSTQALTAWTVHSSGTTAGERLALLANEKQNWRVPLDQLGFSSKQLTALNAVLKTPDGLLIVASPPHMGRTTTLYSFIAAHDAFTTSIQTMETNPRVDFESVTVNHFDPQANEVGHARALQSIMLKDPHVLLVAQCPDPATANLITRYAAEEHRIYLGVRGMDALSTLAMWRKIVPDSRASAQAIRAIIAQRLVRLLCPTCKVAYRPDTAMIAKLNLPVGRDLQAFRANPGEPVSGRDSRGGYAKCPDCNGLGYRGQTGIFEVLLVDDEIHRAIAEGEPIETIRTLARKNGMQILVEHGIHKFAMGVTSLQEVLRVCGGDKKPAPKNPLENTGDMP